MKTKITIFTAMFLTCLSLNSFSQTYNGAFYEMFFEREPSARAEAMGKHLSALPGDPLSYYYNPAGMASLKGLNLNASFAGPYYTRFDEKLNDSRYDFFGAFYNVRKYGTAGLSMDYFTFGYDKEIIITDEFGNQIGKEKYDPDITNYRLTLSSEVIKDLFVGVNFNLLHPDFDLPDLTVGNEKMGDDKDVFYFDLGVIKSFNFDSKKLNQDVSLGMSLINVFSAEYNSSSADYSGMLPAIFRFGASYNLSLNDRSISSKLKSYNFLIDGEYEDLFNSKYYGGFHAGFEFTFLEILALRAGFYSQENVYRVYNYDTLTGGYLGYTDTENMINEFTYGFGINIPIKQLTGGKTPIEIKFDYANLNQPAYKKDKDSPGKFHVYTIIFNWVF